MKWLIITAFQSTFPSAPADAFFFVSTVTQFNWFFQPSYYCIRISQLAFRFFTIS